MLTFIDESGYPRPTDSTKNPILLGVCIHENDIKPITNQIYKLKDSIYGKQDEIKSTKLIREATITKNSTKNREYVEGMVDIITSYDAAIFAIIMDKPDEPIIVPEHHLLGFYLKQILDVLFIIFWKCRCSLALLLLKQYSLLIFLPVLLGTTTKMSLIKKCLKQSFSDGL